MGCASGKLMRYDTGLQRVLKKVISSYFVELFITVTKINYFKFV